MNMFRNLFMVFTGGVLLVGCALPSDPPVEDTLGPALARIGHQSVANLNTPAAAKPDKPKKPTPEDLEAIEDARMERRILAMAHYAAGVAHRERGEGREATEEFYQAALADPTNEKIVMEVVQILLRSRQSEKLFQLLIKATKDPEAPANIHALLAANYLERKKPDLAKVAAENAIRKGPKLIVGYKSLIQVYRQEAGKGAKRTAQIRKVLDRAMEQKEVSTAYQVELALMLLGYLELDKNAADELKPKISKLLDGAWAGKPKEPLLLENLARAYRVNGTHDKAAAVMESLLKLLPNNPVVLLEAAGCIDRYHAIVARPVVVGAPTAQQQDAADALQGVLESAIETIRPGLTAGEVDRTCRQVVEQRGFGKYFKHRSAYGIGIGFPPNWSEGHIYAIRPDDPLVLEPNMTFHVIPTLFLDDFGMCFSDSVKVTETGCEPLTNFPRRLFVAAG